MDAMKDQLEQLVERLQTAAGENLESIVLYGSAARDDFSEQYSDLNLLCILRDASVPALDCLAPVVEWWSKSHRHRPPLFLTEEELRTSADVFAIETLDLVANHRLLAGRDVLSGIAVPLNLHRLQVEHELRTLLLRLRQHYLLFSGKDEDLEKVLAKTASSTLVLLRHALLVRGHTPAGPRRDVLAQVEAAFGVESAPVHAALDLRDGRRLEISVSELYQRYLQLLAQVVQRVDEAAPKKEWQRVPADPDPTSQERNG